MDARLKAALAVAVLVGLIGCTQQQERRFEHPVRKEVKLQVGESYAVLALPKGRWLRLPGWVAYTATVGPARTLGKLTVAERMINLDLDAPSRYAALNFRFVSSKDEPVAERAAMLIFDDLGVDVDGFSYTIDQFSFQDGTTGWFLRIDDVERNGPRPSGLVGVVKRIDKGLVVATSLVSTRHEYGRRRLLDALESAFRSISVRQDL